MIIQLVLLLLTLPLFFFKLGQSSLVSWDEAWYGSITKNILAQPTPFALSFNGEPYFDHPPFGFWLMAVSTKIFGINEFGVRAASAIAGVFCLIFIYLLGRRLFGQTVGVASSLALVSSPWFLFRARSGNLDIFLTLFFVSTIYLAHLSTTNKRFLTPFAISLACLFLTKTMIPITILPVIVVIFWKKINIADLLRPGLWFCIITAIWFVPQIVMYPGFVKKYLAIGFPQAKTQTSIIDNILLMKSYLHFGIGNWFRPGIVTLVISAFTLQKRFWIFFLVVLAFMFPFIFSSKGQIWHLIPTHPFIILGLFGLVSVVFKKFAKAAVITLCLLIAVPQIQKNWYEFIDIPAYVSDEAILATEASYYPHPLIIDGEFVPTAAFYSEKIVKQAQPKLENEFTSDDPFLLITHQWRLDQANISPKNYRIIKSDRDMILVMALPNNITP